MAGKALRSAPVRQLLTVAPFLLPGLALFAVFVAYPLARGVQMSFYEWNILPGAKSQFIGLANYRRAFSDATALMAMRNTLLYVLITVPGQIVIGLGSAVLLNSGLRGRVFFRTLYYIPVVTSWVVVALVFEYLFSSGPGVINYFLARVLRVIPDYINWMSSTWTAFVPIWALGIWKGVGWTMVVFLAGLQSIPRDLYEAADIDGASRWQQFRHITLPLIRPTFLFVLVMLTIGAFNVFVSVFLITGGGPLGTTEVILSYMYKQAFRFFDFGYGVSQAVLLALVIVTISLIQFRFIRNTVD